MSSETSKRNLLNVRIINAVVIVLIQCTLNASQCHAQVQVQEKDLKGIVRTSLDSPKPTKTQVARRSRNNGVVKAMGLPLLETLPVTEDETTVKCRSADEILRRCLSVEICAIKGESNDQSLTNVITTRFGAATFFSPKEKLFINNEKPSKQDLINFAWQYERVHVLLWALGLVDRLKNSNEVCDVASEAKLLRTNTMPELMRKARPRTISEIMNQADLYYRLHWAAMELRLHQKSSKNVDEEIVRERHHALNWLIRYQNQKWDDITTDT